MFFSRPGLAWCGSGLTAAVSETDGGGGFEGEGDAEEAQGLNLGEVFFIGEKSIVDGDFLSGT